MLSVRDRNQNNSQITSVPLLDVGKGNGPLENEILSAFSEIDPFRSIRWRSSL